MQTIIRPATIADAAGIFETHSRSIHELCVKDYTPAQIAGWMPKERNPKTYEEWILNSETLYFVAEQNNKIVGVASTTENRISTMYAHPDFILQGIARKLFDYTESELRRLGYTNMMLSSTITAFPFYLKMGMKFIEDRSYTFKNGEEVIIKYMEKDLRT